MATITRCDVEELSLLTNSLLWELSERGLEVVNKARLQRAFSPLVTASKEKLNEEVDRHRLLISETYGEDAEQAFRCASDLESPIVLEGFYAQKAETLTRRLEEAVKVKEAAQEQARLAEKDRKELEQLRAEKKLREQKARKNQRKSSASKKKKKRRK